MIKILNKEQIRELDAVTISRQNITSTELMECAAEACSNHICNIISENTKNLVVVCGKGNNGGDGLAIARLVYDRLGTRGLNLSVYIIDQSSERTSNDFQYNYEKLKSGKKIKVEHLNENNLEVFKKELFSIRNESLIVDAIYGTGLNRPVSGFTGELIKTINETLIPVISIDVPSGLMPDEFQNPETSNIIYASITLSFQQPKYTFLLPETGKFCGEFIVLDIGLDNEFIKESKCENFYIERTDISSLLKKRGKFSHKGTFGHALIIAGSLGKMGAAFLSSKACLKSGAGLLTIHVPSCGTNILQNSLPEAMVSQDSNYEYLTELPELGTYNAIGFGPGIGTKEESGKVLKQIFQNYQGKLVIDADGINLLSENKTLLGFLPPLSILTPHPKEFDRLTEKHNNSFERIETAKQLATKYHLIIILKGAHTAIVTPNGNIYFNSTGNPGMAKGGSGDVLTGILTGLLARGYGPLEASFIGVYLHGLAGDLAAEISGEESMLASELIDHISEGFIQLEK